MEISMRRGTQEINEIGANKRMDLTDKCRRVIVPAAGGDASNRFVTAYAVHSQCHPFFFLSVSHPER